MLIAWKCVEDPLWTSCLLSVFPLRYFSYRCVLSNDSVYLSCVFMAFIAYRGARLGALFWSIAIATLFSEQGVVLALSFAFGFFVFGHYAKARCVLLAWLVGSAPTMIIQLVAIRRPFAFFRSRFSNDLGFGWIPFKELFWAMQGVSGLAAFHTYFIVFGAASIGLLFLWPLSFVVPAFVIATIIYVSILDFGRFFRAAAALEVFTVLVAFDSFFRSKRFSRNFFVVCLVVASLAVTVCSLRAPTFSPRFLDLFLHNQL
jgi:hypothetical protein